MWKQFLLIGSVVLAGVIVEVSLIYLGKIYGTMPFAISVKPQVEMF